MRFNIIAIMREIEDPTNQANLHRDSRLAWQLPNTEDDPFGDPLQSKRAIEVTFTVP